MVQAYRPPLPPPENKPKHGDVWLDPTTMEAMMYDGIVEKWFKMTHEQYLQYKGKLPLSPVAVSGVISVPKHVQPRKKYPQWHVHCASCGKRKEQCTCNVPPKEKPIEDFGFEDELFQI